MYSFYLGRNIGTVKNAVRKKDAVKTFAEMLKIYRIDGFTVLSGSGFWRGVEEKMIIFQVCNIPDTSAVNLAAQLAAHYSQDAVMLVRHIANDVFFIKP